MTFSQVINLVMYISMAVGVLFAVTILYFIKFRKPSNNRKTIKKESHKDIQKESVHKFMEFDEVIDDMIIDRNLGKRTMVVQCQGINYDLMSEAEKIGIEEGFISFLNTLRYPIQLYVQTRTVNLGESINNYRQRVVNIEQELENIVKQLNSLQKMPEANQNKILTLEYLLRNKRNVLEYAKDMVYHVEQMSLNRNILQRKYYVVVSYYESEIGLINKFSKEDIQSICYRELFTRCQSMIGALMACSVQGKILSSNELVELLYNAYNRDDADTIDIKNTLENGFDYRLQTLSDDAHEKRNELIKKEIEEQAFILAQDAITRAIEEGTYVAPEEFEEAFNDEVNKQATELLLEQEDELEPEVLVRAIDILEENMNELKANDKNSNKKEEKSVAEENVEQEKIKENIDTQVDNENVDKEAEDNEK